METVELQGILQLIANRVFLLLLQLFLDEILIALEIFVLYVEGRVGFESLGMGDVVGFFGFLVQFHFSMQMRKH